MESIVLLVPRQICEIYSEPLIEEISKCGVEMDLFLALISKNHRYQTFQDTKEFWGSRSGVTEGCILPRRHHDNA